MVGRTLLHYEILEKLGEGGMGTVYKARDTHLDRFVAVKVLQADVVTNADRKRRFVQEAKAASALNHPNIVHIYDIASDDGVDFIAMEYVAGRTLEAIIGHRSMPAGQILKYAIQAADALVKAHSAGIIHRDLKPGNVMLNDDGVVKVLDFGLAKLTESASGGIGADQETVTLPLNPGARTEEGVLLGTVAYMSPEQAECKPLDSRSDIFSFGALLYEMVTGKRAFQGESKLSTLTLILHQEPTPPSQIVPATPLELEKLIARCLRKNADRRFQSMADLRAALLDLKEDSESGKSLRWRSPGHTWQKAWIAPGATLLITALAFTWWVTHSKVAPAPPAPKPLTVDSGVTYMPAISRDGKFLAYASDRADGTNLDIWVQQIGGGLPIRLTRHEADDKEPDFSADGTRIVFASARDGGGIYVVPTLGGEPDKRIVDMPHATAPRFSPDGKWIVYRVTGLTTNAAGSRIFLSPALGGEPRQLVANFESVGDPLWSEDSRHILVGSPHPTKPPSDPAWDWWAVPVDGGQPVRTDIYKRLREQGVRFTAAADWVGGYFYLSGGTGTTSNVWRVALSPKTLQASGVPERLTSGTGREQMPRISTAGLLTFAATNLHRDMYGLPLDVNTAKVAGKLEQLTRDQGLGGKVSLTPDGAKLVFVRQLTSGRVDLCLQDVRTGATTALVETSPSTPPFVGGITPRSSSVIYTLVENNKRVGYRIPIEGGTPQKICDDCCLWDMSSDETKLLSCLGNTQSRNRKAGWIELATGKTVELMEPANYAGDDLRLSPDDRWMAFGIEAPGHPQQLYAVRLRPERLATKDDWIAISDGTSNDAKPRWSPDGQMLYFISDRDGSSCLWARRFDRTAGRPAGEAFGVHHFHNPAMHLEFGPFALARDKIAMLLVETRSNLWTLQVP
jgi:serine/threonine protein kinase/Tol biopolymer transport system component